jgi:ABC-2 type transport system permease protein
MINRPGSAWWLLRHELRLMRAQAMVVRPGGKRGLERKTILTWSVTLVLLHAAAFLIVLDAPVLSSASPGVVSVLAAMLAGIVLFMMASGMKAAYEAVYERGDFDLLFSSPLAPRSILAVRMLAVSGRVAGLYLVFFAPLANVSLALGNPRLLAIYPVTLAVATIAGALSMAITLLLVRLFGARVARMTAQVVGPLFGAALFVAGQLYGTPVGGPVERGAATLGSLIQPDGPAWLGARAALGEMGPVLTLVAGALAAYLAAVVILQRFFAHGVQQAAALYRKAAPASRPIRFRQRRGLLQVVLVKEWTLIARDTRLLSQVLLQMLYLLPLMAALLAKTGASLASLTVGITFLCASITSALSWIVVSAEEAPDLLASSPADPRMLARAKLIAVILPVLALLALPVLWTAMRQPLAALLMGTVIVCACLSAALIAFSFARPAARGDFKQRSRGNPLASLFDLLTMSAWAATAYLLVDAAARAAWTPFLLVGAGGSAACALLFLALARLWRQARPGGPR